MATFFESPILNSPYALPSKHWELSEAGTPTSNIIEARRGAKFISPIPNPKRRAQASGSQAALGFGDVHGLSTPEQQYDPSPTINLIREKVAAWRNLGPDKWRVSPETARLLTHWRHHQFSGPKPFFCQLEAVETAIWLTEVAPEVGKEGERLLEYLNNANADANPGLNRLALKLATGAGKTTVMAMLIAWQTLNAVRRPNAQKFTKGFLIITPGITIKDRLRVLLPNDPDSYYQSRELVPADMLRDLHKAQIVITNYHAFKLRDTLSLAKGTRVLLQGHGPQLNTTETPGQMLQRVMPELLGLKRVMVLNDEAHHCYREKPSSEEADIPIDEADDVKRNKAAARLWISGIEALATKIVVNRVMDLSATPFFLRGSGYAEGTMFPWVMSDFSLLDAIECGIVKLPRVPVADNIKNADVPIFRDLWNNIRDKMPKAGRSKHKDRGNVLNPDALPPVLLTAIQALYGHYEKTFDLWLEAKVGVAPCFIVVCNNTSTSKLIYDYIAGYIKTSEDGARLGVNGRLPLFDNFDHSGQPRAKPFTLLIDSEQLESGDGLDDNFKQVAADELECFRKAVVQRTGNLAEANKLADEDILREVMNTVGRKGRLGESIRCVVSVSMLTEGWDANTVTHVLGVRAFGTQLLCEQVVGRALRRLSYQLNDRGLFDPEYADVLGIPFNFTAQPVIAKPQPPPHTVQVKAIRPERDTLEITFPRVVGFRQEPPAEVLSARFSADSTLVITPELVGPTITHTAGIIGEEATLSLEQLKHQRLNSLAYRLTQRLVEQHFRDTDGNPMLHFFGQLKRITLQWLQNHLVCEGDTYPALLHYVELANMACDRIHAAISRSFAPETPVRLMLDPFNPLGSTAFVNYNTVAKNLWETDPRKCHLNYLVCDSDWEAECCRMLENHPRVHAYVKNHNLGFEIPYPMGANPRRYRPDFIALLDGGALNLILETKGFRDEADKIKRETTEVFWLPAVNAARTWGIWAFVELRNPFQLEADLNAFLKDNWPLPALPAPARP